MKTGLSLFWRVLIIQLVFSLVGVLLLAGTSLNSDIGLIRLKPTIAQVSFALVLWLSIYLSKNGLIYLVWGRRLGLETPSWRSFTKMLAALMVILGGANLATIYFLTLEQWITFKATIPLAIEIIFCLTIPRVLKENLAEQF